MTFPNRKAHVECTMWANDCKRRLFLILSATYSPNDVIRPHTDKFWSIDYAIRKSEDFVIYGLIIITSR